MNFRNQKRYIVDKEREIYAGIRASTPLIVRADGRNFKRVLLEHKFQKPYDERFVKGIVDSTELFFVKSGFDPLLAYIFSDEISLYFRFVPFRGRIEKLDSIIASFLASALTIALDFKDPIAFDARVIPVCGDEEVVAYFAQRQAEAWRNHINAYGYYGLIESGLSAREAEKRLRGIKAEDVHEILFQMGINLKDTPSWQRRGIMVVRHGYEKEGYDPRAAKNVTVTVTRYKITQLWDLPLFNTEEGENLIRRYLREEE
ncbi:MAG: hypothetical protein N2V76_01240 [Methanophagales archaeon]|nr:hypothetical protein [Methanophagales archaeon]MCW7069361.1 hypothetical protein [Methanophagales archaeon]